MKKVPQTSERTCAECLGPIIGKRPDAKYCSCTCRAAAEKRRHREREGASVKRRGPYNVPRKSYDTKLAATNARTKRRYHQSIYGRVLETPEDIMKYAKDRYARARAEGYRSGLEVQIARELEEQGVQYTYEENKISYIVPERLATYKPDFYLPNGIVVETKGQFNSDDRKKHLLVKQQYPDLDLRFVFSNSKSRISKQSKTTYADWCDKNGFKYADKSIPTNWLKE